MDQASLFVLPSRTEGLPRALLEAMAHALPCLGSDIGGIPELLAPEDLVPVNNPERLAERTAQRLADPKRLDEMSRRNWERSQQHADDAVAIMHTAFLEEVKRRTTMTLRHDTPTSVEVAS